jgi:hypothetical protein
MMSLGLNNPQKIAQDPTAEGQNVIIEPADDVENFLATGTDPKQGPPVSAVFRPKEMDNTGSARVLWIHTSLYLAG